MKKLLLMVVLLLMAGCATTGLRQAEETGASKRVSDLDEITTAPAGTEELFVNESGTSKKITVDNLMKRLQSEITSYEIHGANLSNKVVSILVYDDSTAPAVGNGAGDFFFRVPSVLNGWNLKDVEAAHQTVCTGTGSQKTTIQVYNVSDSVNMLSTALTIDEDEYDSLTAVVPAVVNTSYDDVATGDRLRIDISTVPNPGTGITCRGLLVELQFGNY
jgi:hypothetical protein